jgi:SAM-dependent methyltransferase
MRDLELLKKWSPPPQRLLDFGCGIGLQSFLLARNGYDVFGLETVEDKSLDDFYRGKAESHIATRDTSMKSVWSTIKEHVPVEFRFYDGKKQPFPNSYFDVVFAYAVIEHIPPDAVPGILNEIHRVLKSNGILFVFQLPRRSSYTEFIARKMGFESHPFLWDLHSIGKLLKGAGFSISFSQRVDMLINHPYRIINPIFPLSHALNEFLIHTPLSHFAHHLTVVAKKTDAG